MQRKVLITDYAWADLEIEREILESTGLSMVAAATGSEEELLALVPDVDGILACWKTVREVVIERACRCVSIGRLGIGLDNIDVACATRLGIVVTNVPDYCVDEVSDHTLALLLAFGRKIVFFDRATKAGIYDLVAQGPLRRLAKCTLGIVGYGRIGRAVARKARAFGLTILVFDPGYDSAPETDRDARKVDFIELLENSDFVSIHTPLTNDTRDLFSTEAFRRMKPTSFLINTSRGAIVDSSALLAALREGLLAGAALDVLPQEPPAADDPLLRHCKIVITPHAAFSSVESVATLRSQAARQIAAAVSGRLPANIVNPEVLQQENLRMRSQRVTGLPS